ncbi:alpha/beta hydrolase [Rubellimicrobium roseum]|uniref:Phospholipase n=1 Tax=Rubellimicrobium roseum TaxID=687525 RepID=A0A5C4NC57_9RHOB|nr:phospholipase [Rubellimicrobium roseum]TNC64001.1 phospholipase [Rubellimicrobium roseum]
MAQDREWLQGRLLARPAGANSPAVGRLKAGRHPLGLRPGRDGLLRVPASLRLPVPLLIILHGAGGTAVQSLSLVADRAERHGVLVLAPESEGSTWDVIRPGYGPDVSHIDRALGRIFASFEVDAERIAVGGFSDGASYALSLGITNGALFRDILALSPGFTAPTQAEDAPRIFISHGTEDRVLPIDRCSRRLAPALREAGYDLDYREFAGGHVVPTKMVDAAFARFLGETG